MATFSDCSASCARTGAASSPPGCSPPRRWWRRSRSRRSPAARSTRSAHGDKRASSPRSASPSLVAGVAAARRSPSRGGSSPGASRSASSTTCASALYDHLLVARARLLRPPADRPADVARDGRPAGRALLPRLRARLHRAVGADDRARRGRDVRHRPGARGRSRCCPVPFVVWIAARYGRRSRPALQEVQQRIAELTADVEENVRGVRVVKAFAREERQLARFRTQRRPRLRPVDDLDAAAGVLQPVHRLPAAARPRGDAALRRPPGHRRRR